jgi:hypothetical protein
VPSRKRQLDPLLGSAFGRLRSELDPRENPLHVLIRRRLQPGIRRSCCVVLAKHLGHGLWIKLLCPDEEAIRFLIMADGLLVEALLG